MTSRERDAIELLDRIYGFKAGKPLLDDCMTVEWIQQEIAAFIRKHGTFESLLNPKESDGSQDG